MNAPAEFRLRRTQALESSVERGRQMVQVFGPAVRQGVVHLVPYCLIGIEFGGIGGETLQVQSWKAATQCADRFTLVGFAIVPEDEQVATKVPQQMTQKVADFGLADVLAMKLGIQPELATPRADRHGGNG